MIIKNNQELEGIKKAAEVVAIVLEKLKRYTCVGMSTKQIDKYAEHLFERYNASSAPIKLYQFPGHTCISVNEVMAHGIPDENKILYDGDLINIDVSAEVDGFYADNGTSFVVGDDINNYQQLVDDSKKILAKIINEIKHGLKITSFISFIENLVSSNGYCIIQNLDFGHGVGYALHQQPFICYDRQRSDYEFFEKDMVVAIEIFISKYSTFAVTLKDRWTMIGNTNTFTCQQEHTILVTDNKPIILTEKNGIFN